jgi:hypothetical protein
MNNRALEIGGAGFHKQHQFFDTTVLMRFQEAVTTAPPREGHLIPVPHIWCNCIDKFGQPIMLMCDFWLPCIAINEEEMAAIFALSDSVELVRQPGTFVATGKSSNR